MDKNLKMTPTIPPPPPPSAAHRSQPSHVALEMNETKPSSVLGNPTDVNFDQNVSSPANVVKYRSIDRITLKLPQFPIA